MVFTDFDYRGYAQYFNLPPDGEVAEYGAYDTLEISNATDVLQRDVSLFNKKT